MKPLGRKNYGSIPHLSNSKLGSGDYFINHGQERILTEKKRDRHDEIFVFEKYDGSNVGIAKVNGKIVALTRSGYEASTSPYKQHHLFAKWVEFQSNRFVDFLMEGERVCGEWLVQAHGLKYEIKGNPITFFDYFNNNNERMPFDFLHGTGLPIPRLLHRGDSVSVKELLPILNEKTQWLKSEELPEGMVYRVEKKGKVDFLAKWVRSDFEPGKYMIDKEDNELVWNIEI